MIIDIDKLEPNSYNPNSMSELKFNALIKSIKEEKWNRLFPIEVLPEENWKYKIIDWEHRYKAMKEAWIKLAHIEISDLEDWYAKLRTLSKNSIHWTHDIIEEAQLIADIKSQWIVDSEIMSSIWIDEKELIAINKLTDFDISDFDNDLDLEDIDNSNELDELETKEIVLKLTDEEYNLIISIEEFTELKDIKQSILKIVTLYKEERIS